MDRELNPYAPPAVLEEPMAGAIPFVAGYESTRRLLNMLVIALLAGLGASMVGVISDAIEIYALQTRPFDDPGSEGRTLFISILQMVTSLTTIVLFARFLYCTNRNARALGTPGMSFTPGWTVGWFFIPFANLYKPYQAVRELWQASDLDYREAWRAAPVPGFLGLWWGAWIVAGVLGQIVFRLNRVADDIDAYLTASYVGIGAQLWDIPLTLLALLLVQRLHDRQERLFREFRG